MDKPIGINCICGKTYNNIIIRYCICPFCNHVWDLTPPYKGNWEPDPKALSIAKKIYDLEKSNQNALAEATLKKYHEEWLKQRNKK